MADYENFRYRLFCISDLEDWLLHNKENGLSAKVIARPRALAFVNNPCAKKDDPVLSIVFNSKDEPVGYTGVFAEEWLKPYPNEIYFWGSTQWLDTPYRGKGVSWNMMWQIKEAVNQKYIASDSTIASCKLDKKQGSDIIYYPKYKWRFKSKNNSLKTIVKEWLIRKQNSKVLEKLKELDYCNRYVNYVDDMTYDFIKSHCNNDLFLRKQEIFNWQLRYPFVLPNENDAKLETEACKFGGYVNKYKIQAVQVWSHNELCGFYMLNHIDNVCKVQYLYFIEGKERLVFSSILCNILQQDVDSLHTFSHELFDFFQEIGLSKLNRHDIVEQVSLTIPNDFVVNPNLRLQGGDGDMFT